MTSIHVPKDIADCLNRIDEALDEFEKGIEKNNGFASRRRARKKIVNVLFDISSELADVEVQQIMRRLGLYEINFGDSDASE